MPHTRTLARTTTRVTTNVLIAVLAIAMFGLAAYGYGFGFAARTKTAFVPTSSPKITAVQVCLSSSPTLAVPQAYPTIKAALHQAQKDNYCHAVVEVSGGTYSDDLVITRATDIIGVGRSLPVIAGTLTNTGSHKLILKTLTFKNTPLPAAITVKNAKAVTELWEVLIVNAKGFGIRQSGGTLSLHAVEVDQTGIQGAAVRGRAVSRFRPASLPRYSVGLPPLIFEFNEVLKKSVQESAVVSLKELEIQKALNGTGVYVESGTTLEIDTLTLKDNFSHGLVVRGSGTLAKGTKLTASGTTHDGSLSFETGGGLYRYAGVTVADGASLLVDGLELADNDGFGILLLNGSKVHLKNAVLHGSKKVGTVEGNNIMLAGGSILEMHGVDVAYADLAGFWNDGSYLTVTDGAFHDNTFGGVTVGLPQLPNVNPLCIDPAQNNSVYDNSEGDKVQSLDLSTAPLGGTCKTVPWQ
ncbi:right-handed parallel beta-helix repeat-containing protein [Candidatus Uhrbacteria bacterium]|nr:right-handed parallel beta-helix repeat-containing protein [Candidatus Uhrbacteria bacterium]